MAGPSPPPRDLIRRFVAFLRAGRLEALADAQRRMCEALELPVTLAHAHLSDEEQRRARLHGLQVMLGLLADEIDLEPVRAQLRQLAEDRLPGTQRSLVTVEDLALVIAAQRDAVLEQVSAFTHDRDEALALVQAVGTASRRLQRESLFHIGGADRQREAFVRTLLEHVPAGVAYLDRELVVRTMNAACEATWGRPAADFVGKALPDVFPTMQMPNPRFEAVLERGEVVRDRAILGHRPFGDGAGETWWDVTYVPVRGPAGDIDGVLSFGIEVSERVVAERLQQAQLSRLEEMDRLKDEFLGVLSHELRTPVTAITGFGSALADGLLGDLTPDQRHYVQRMLASADTLMALIEDLLDVTRIRAGKVRLETRTIALAALARDALALLVPQASARGHELVVEIPPDLPEVSVDPRRIGQVIANLVGNALKFTPAPGPIRIQAHLRPGTVVLEVVDRGPGVASCDVERLFTPFTQLDMSASRDAGGAGLGLSICKGLIEAHGGTIGVAPTSGGGATFWFSLPVAEGATG